MHTKMLLYTIKILLLVMAMQVNVSECKCNELSGGWHTLDRLSTTTQSSEITQHV